MIDGMPIVSSLSTVYGLSGIPNSLVERIEIVKGPASSLYGSEAVGGLINIITKNPNNAPQFSVDLFTTSWLETNADLGVKFNVAQKTTSLLGLNYYNYNQTIDNDNDEFTDVTAQTGFRFSTNGISAVNKTDYLLLLFAECMKIVGVATFVGRKKYRGGDEIYGESIYTKRGELLGSYQLPTTEKLMLSFSGTVHFQDSRYGTTSYIANQKIGFLQLTWTRN